MNIFSEFEGKVRDAIAALTDDGVLPAGLDTSRITVEPPREAGHGDIATNAAMALAKPAGVKPRELAEALAEKLGHEETIDKVEVAGPGFINLSLTGQALRDVLRAVIALGAKYGESAVGQGTAVNVEYVSANPTGPMHVGHCRGAVYGDALASLLEKAGYAPTREYYINDAGGQIDVLGHSAYLRYCEALGEDIGDIPEGLYPGDYLKPVGEQIAAADGEKWLGMPETDWLPEFRVVASDAMMDLIRGDLAALGIDQEVFFSERSLSDEGLIDAALDDLEAKGLIYTGVLEPPKGKKPDDWEPRPQTLFRSTEFGDDVDRPLKKSDGSWTYFASDIAYHKTKVDRGFDQLIDVWGADHGGYVKRMQSAVAALTGKKAVLDVRLCQMVRLFRDGKPLVMSKRAGTFVTLRELVDEVGRDVVRFIMLTRKNDAPLDFDFAHVMEQSRDNPVFYVQYAHARICSVFRHAADDIAGLKLSDDGLMSAPLDRLIQPEELAVIKLIANWPRIVETSAAAHEPHRVAFYLYDLASGFHSYWNKGNEDPSLRFLVKDDAELTTARLALIRGVQIVIASGLGIMGVEPVEEML